MRSIFLWSMAFAALTTAPGAALAQHSIDLTGLTPAAQPGPVEKGFSAGVRGIEGSKPVRLPLRLELNWVDRTDLILGSQVVLDVTITNVGQAPIIVPWSPSRDPSPLGSMHERRLQVALVVLSSKAEPQSLGVTALFGSTDRQGTLLEILPGETATIRAPTWLASSSPELTSSLSQGPRVLELHALLDLAVTPNDWAEPVLSKNGIPITLRVESVRQ